MSRALAGAVLLLVLPPTAAKGPLDGVLYDAEAVSTNNCVSRGSVAVMMLAIGAFLLGALYLVHSRHEEIRWLTWRLLSSTLSIFIAVLSNTLVVHLLRQWVVPTLGVHGTCISSFLVVLLVAYLGMFQERRSKLGCKARAIIGGHMGGFGTIHIFGRLQDLPPFRDSPALSALVLPIYAFVWMLVALASSRTRRRLEDCTKDDEETVERLEAESVDFENDIATICLGFLASQTFRFVICGSLPPISGETVDHSEAHDHVLLATAVVLMVLVCVSAVWLDKGKMGACGQRFAALVQGTFAMSSSWCFLFWGQWHLEETVQLGDLLGKVTQAILTSVVSMSLIVFLCSMVERAKVIQKGLREVIEALGLLIGFAWEACFDNVIEDVRPPGVIKFIALALVLIVLPGWRLYVLTRASKAWQLEDHVNPPPLRSLCLDRPKVEEEWEEVPEDDEGSTSDSE